MGRGGDSQPSGERDRIDKMISGGKGYEDGECLLNVSTNDTNEACKEREDSDHGDTWIYLG